MNDSLYYVGPTALKHCWNFMTGDWYLGECRCGWRGRQYRSPDTARRWMAKHAEKCNGEHRAPAQGLCPHGLRNLDCFDCFPQGS